MKPTPTPIAAFLAAFAFCFFVGPASAAWTDVSYDPNPSLIDEDKVAQFDAYGTIVLMASTNNGVSRGIQNFENGFAAGQSVDDWVALGDTRVRFGFGSSPAAVQWHGIIGGIDPYATEFGLTHPHGTYGNQENVLGQPRNYAADLKYLTFDTAQQGNGPIYFVMEFERPIKNLGFSMIDYAAGTGGTASLTLWNGNDINSLVELPVLYPDAQTRTITSGEMAGDFQYWFGQGIISGPPTYQFPSFNFAILRLDTADATIGFDNFVVGIAPVPEPKSYAMMGSGLLMLGALAGSRRRRGR